jgi:hypothetical protein
LICVALAPSLGSMTLDSLADDLGLDRGDVSTMAVWLRSHDDEHTLIGGELDLAVRSVLDPGGERTAHAYTCPTCGRWPAPNRFLAGWHACRCGGHATRYCTPDTGGCGTTTYDPLIDPEACRDPSWGFDPPS